MLDFLLTFIKGVKSSQILNLLIWIQTPHALAFFVFLYFLFLIFNDKPVQQKELGAGEKKNMEKVEPSKTKKTSKKNKKNSKHVRDDLVWFGEPANMKAEKETVEEVQTKLLAENKAADLSAKLKAEKDAEVEARIQAEREAAEVETKLKAEGETAEAETKLKAVREAAELEVRLKAEREAAECETKLAVDRASTECKATLKIEREAADSGVKLKAEKEEAKRAVKVQTVRLTKAELAEPVSVDSSFRSQPRVLSHSIAVVRSDIIKVPTSAIAPLKSHPLSPKIFSSQWSAEDIVIPEHKHNANTSEKELNGIKIEPNITSASNPESKKAMSNEIRIEDDIYLAHVQYLVHKQEPKSIHSVVPFASSPNGSSLSSASKTSNSLQEQEGVNSLCGSSLSPENVYERNTPLKSYDPEREVMYDFTWSVGNIAITVASENKVESSAVYSMQTFNKGRDVVLMAHKDLEDSARWEYTRNSGRDWFPWNAHINAELERAYRRGEFYRFILAL